MEEELSGLILYTKELDGCLNGVYTNNLNHGEILNEIAIKIDRETLDSLDGDYHCSYFNSVEQATRGILKINTVGRTLNFVWIVDGNIAFRGIGYFMNHNQISVRYWQAVN